MRFIAVVLVALSSMMLLSCGGGSSSGGARGKLPLDEIIQSMEGQHPYSIALYDMEIEGTFFKTYRHQYKVYKDKKEVTDGDQTLSEEKTSWYEVPKAFYIAHQEHLGMELAAMDSTGKLSKTVRPAGYGNYIGNRRYGYWETRNGHSFWAFYGQYMFMSHMFNMAMYPVRRDYYRNYQRSYSSGKPYYGSNYKGGRRYGTSGTKTRSSRPDFYSRSASRTGYSRSSSRSSSGSRGGYRGGGRGK